MLPKTKIQIYHNDALLHTLDNEASGIHIKDILTVGIGTWSFILPSKKNGDFLYNDVALHDTVKIYLGYDSVGATPLTKGRIAKITGLETDAGFIRVYEGKNQGEVLHRRLKRDNSWVNTDASAIATELANDLGLGTGQIETETTDESLTSKMENYQEVLSKTADYWASPEVQIRKDFYVDVDNNLVWKSRPIRTGNVETLTVGQNILNYSVLKDVSGVKNKIYVYGRASASAIMPKDENWTESLSEWTVEQGYLGLDPTFRHAGNYSIRMLSEPVAEDDNRATVRRTMQTEYQCINGYQEETHSSFGSVCTYAMAQDGNTSDIYARTELLSGSTSYFYKNYSVVPKDVWTPMGAHALGTDTWFSVGSPNWRKITGIRFKAYCAKTFYFLFDDLEFRNGYFYHFASDATSQTNYGLREMEHFDEKLNSDAECQIRGETLLYQLKDPVTRVDLEVIGNSNIKIGDRLMLTIPSENISSQNFDIVSVEHNVTTNGWTTKAHLVGTANTRQLPSTTPLESIEKHLAMQRDIIRGVQLMK